MTYDFSNEHVRVKGLSKTVRALTKAGADTQDMKELMHEIGMIVIKASMPPSQSGALEGSLRAGRGKTKAVAKAGGARVPYAGVIHYGWPARNIEATNFLTDALTNNREEVFRKMEEGLGEILKKNDLK